MKVLVVYKKNALQGMTRRRVPLRGGPFALRDVRRLRDGLRAHEAALEQVKRALRLRGVTFRAVYRARAHDYSPYQGIISVGGDGTFLEAARRSTTQWILGVNSDPARSSGTFCAADRRSFGRLLDRVLCGSARVEKLHRLSITLNGKPLGISLLNDVLVTDLRPAAMSRYWLKVGARSEEQRSSGLWISTAAGSTGAIRSAGGAVLPRTSSRVQYRPRELYRAKGFSCRLTGGLVPPGAPVAVGSLMKEGLICADGEHFTAPFRYGDLLRVRPARHPLKRVVG